MEEIQVTTIDTIEDLLREANQSSLLEHKFQNLELKRGWDKDYGKNISALGNKIGVRISWMVIGMDDNGNAAGKDEQWAIQTSQNISQQLNSFLDPIQTCSGINSYNLNNGWIVVIKINNPGTVVKWERFAYKSSGTTISFMSPEEILQFTIELPGLTDYSKQDWDGVPEEALVNEFAKKLCETRKDLGISYSQIKSYSNLPDINKILKRNVSKILFGNCKYRVVFYDKDNQPVRNVDRYGLYGLLEPKFIDEVQNWAKDFNSHSTEPFPVLALKEGLANSVAHATYFERDGEIIIEIFKDKVVISNLCLPESEYFANRWFSRSHKTVNELLMETLRLVKIVDELGRGKNIIFTDSIKKGKQPPQVSIEKAGMVNRWRLHIFGNITNKIYLKLLERIKKTYPEENKALIAYALVLWRNQPVSTIRKFIDGESAPLFVEVLTDIHGPIFYYQKNDEIALQRWVRILLEEGKDSKTFTMAEEEQLYDFAYDMQMQFHNALITPKELRELAHMGETKSEQSLSSNLLKKWEEESKLTKIKKGIYKFIGKDISQVNISKLLALLQDTKL